MSTIFPVPDRWYFNLKKPAWTPSSRVIGLIWSVLYPLIIATFIYVIWKVSAGEITVSTLYAFLFNLVVNILFTPILFGWKDLKLAALDIVFVLGSIIAIMVLSWPSSHIIAFALTPYLIWVMIATFLQFSITWMNR